MGPPFGMRKRFVVPALWTEKRLFSASLPEANYLRGVNFDVTISTTGAALKHQVSNAVSPLGLRMSSIIILGRHTADWLWATFVTVLMN